MTAERKYESMAAGARRELNRRARERGVPGTDDPVVHYVTIGHGCCNAIKVTAHQAGPQRDLFVLMPGGHASLASVATTATRPSRARAPGTSATGARNWARTHPAAPRRTRKFRTSGRNGTSWGTAEVLLDDSHSVTGRALVLGQGTLGNDHEFIDAARSAKADDPVWITDGGGFVLAVIVPAEEYHPAGHLLLQELPLERPPRGEGPCLSPGVPAQWQVAAAWLLYETDRLRAGWRLATGRCPGCPKPRGGLHELGCAPAGRAPVPARHPHRRRGGGPCPAPVITRLSCPLSAHGWMSIRDLRHLAHAPGAGVQDPGFPLRGARPCRQPDDGLLCPGASAPLTYWSPRASWSRPARARRPGT